MTDAGGIDDHPPAVPDVLEQVEEPAEEVGVAKAGPTAPRKPLSCMSGVRCLPPQASGEAALAAERRSGSPGEQDTGKTQHSLERALRHKDILKA